MLMATGKNVDIVPDYGSIPDIGTTDRGMAGDGDIVSHAGLHLGEPCEKRHDHIQVSLLQSLVIETDTDSLSRITGNHTERFSEEMKKHLALKEHIKQLCRPTGRNNQEICNR